MNIAINGATGKFGRLFTAKLLTNPNYQLTLISRTVENIPMKAFPLQKT